MGAATVNAKPRGEETQMNLDEYRALVLRVMENSRSGENPGPRVFDNYGADHARIVLETIFKHAKTDIRVYAEKLNRKTFDAQWIQEFLDRCPDGNIRILAEKDVFSDPESALYEFRGHVSERMEFRLARVRGLHMTIGDGNFVRVETSHNEREAVISFGDSKLSQMATDKFETLWQSGEPLSAPRDLNVDSG